MNKEAKIYVAGHRGMVGSAIVRELRKQGYNNLILKTHAELDLTRQNEVETFFAKERPEYVFLAAAKVGGIEANQSALADFMYENMIMEMNVIHSAWKNGCKKLEFLGSSCIYPRMAPQPIKEEYLLTTKLFCGYCGAYLCGESGTSHTGNVHHYYKGVSVKKKRTECHKKSVRKEWIEDLVVSETMKMVMDDKAIEAIVSMLMDLQDRENVNLPLYEQQLREADTAIQNLLNAIQQGILTKSTKSRLEELEATKEELEAIVLE